MVTAPLKDADPTLALCSACRLKPQIMHCAREYGTKYNKYLRKDIMEYCEKGFCEQHLPADYADGQDWYCQLHRPSKQRTML